MAGKKWCQYCRINLPYEKKAIQDHQSTQRHIQNKEKHIKFQRIKIKKQQKATKQEQKANSFTSTANVPKAKKNSELEQQVSEYRNDVFMTGKMAIHQLIAQKTQGMFGAPIQYPNKQDLVLAENYIDEDQKSQGSNDSGKFQMWKIDICEQTGKACFINRISKAKLYEPPKGYVMSEEQKQQWEETLKICQQVPDQNQEDAGIVGQWEQIVEQEDYFQQNKASEDQSQPDPVPTSNPVKLQHSLVKQQVKLEHGKSEVPQNSWMQQLKCQVQNNEVNENEVIGTILTNTLNECRTVKQRNEALKKLIKNDFEIRATLDQHDDELMKQSNNNGNGAPVGFKPRKKTKVSKDDDFF